MLTDRLNEECLEHAHTFCLVCTPHQKVQACSKHSSFCQSVSQRERERERGRKRGRDRERYVEYGCIIFFKEMTGALAPFSYLVTYICLLLLLFLCPAQW